MLSKPTRAVSGKDDSDADVSFDRHGTGAAMSSEEQIFLFLFFICDRPICVDNFNPLTPNDPYRGSYRTANL